jgi:hypothetical protein
MATFMTTSETHVIRLIFAKSRAQKMIKNPDIFRIMPREFSYMHIYYAHISVKTLCDLRILRQCCSFFKWKRLLLSSWGLEMVNIASIATLGKAYTDKD